MILDPSATTLGDICTEALRECGHTGLGQTPQAEDINSAWARAQLMLQQWYKKRWFIYHLVNLSIVSTGALSYSVGPGGDINTTTGSNPTSARPNKIEGAFLRQLVSGAGSGTPNLLNQFLNVDFPLEVLQSFEDYNRIRIKSLMSFPRFVYYDPAIPLGNLFVWPVPNPSIYQIFILVKEQLPFNFVAGGQASKLLATVINLPPEYFAAILYNLALRLRSRYQIPSTPGDSLPALAKESLNVLRAANTAIARLQMPRDLIADGQYNIFGDNFY